jgi:hypothetical protein
MGRKSGAIQETEALSRKGQWDFWHGAGGARRQTDGSMRAISSPANCVIEYSLK